MWRWTLSWRRELRPEEFTQLSQLQGILQHQHPVKDGQDKVTWSTKGTFTVKELMSEATKIRDGLAEVDSLVCNVWKNVAPPKVEFMLWLALLGKLNTKDLLVKKGVLPNQANQCSLCHAHPENIDHILLQCQFSWQVWCNVAAGFGKQIDRQMSFRQFYEDWVSKRVHNPMQKKLYIAAFFAVSWSLWTTRNKKVFDQCELNLEAVCHLVRWRIAFWSKAWKEHNPYSTEELVRNFHFIPQLFP